MAGGIPRDAPYPLDLTEKRRLLYSKGQDGRRKSAAGALVAGGRLAEALEVLDRLRDPALLEKVRRQAVQAGDLLSLGRAAQLLKADVDPSELRDLASFAERAGRFYDAVNALERAGEAEKAEALRLQHCPDFRPFRPAGK